MPGREQQRASDPGTGAPTRARSPEGHAPVGSLGETLPRSGADSAEQGGVAVAAPLEARQAARQAEESRSARRSARPTRPAPRRTNLRPSLSPPPSGRRAGASCSRSHRRGRRRGPRGVPRGRRRRGRASQRHRRRGGARRQIGSNHLGCAPLLLHPRGRGRAIARAPRGVP